MKQVKVLPEDFTGKDVRKFNRTFGTTFLSRKIRRGRDLNAISNRIKDGIHKAKLMKKLERGELKLIKRTLKEN